MFHRHSNALPSVPWDKTETGKLPAARALATPQIATVVPGAVPIPIANVHVGVTTFLSPTKFSFPYHGVFGRGSEDTRGENAHATPSADPGIHDKITDPDLFGHPAGAAASGCTGAGGHATDRRSDFAVFGAVLSRTEAAQADVTRDPDDLALIRKACAELRGSERLCTCGRTRHTQQPCKSAIHARMAARCRARDRVEDEAAADLADPGPPTEDYLDYLDWRRSNPYGDVS